MRGLCLGVVCCIVLRDVTPGRWGEDRGKETDGEMMSKRRKRVQSEEEEVLDDDRGAPKEGIDNGGRFLNTSPGEVDIEQE